MAKEDILRLKGKVHEVLPNANFRVHLVEQKADILCHVSGKIRKSNINILLGDIVDVELSVYDFSKGRIVWRHK